MKILITGGAGFLGYNLTNFQLRKGNEVVLCDNLSRNGSSANLKSLRDSFPRLKVHQVDLIDVPSIIQREQPDLIYHFAAQVAVTNSVISPHNDFRINAEGTFLVAKASYDIGAPLIYSSTNKAYGDNVNSVPLKTLKTRYDFAGKLARKGISETFSIDAKHHTPYGCSKLTGELYVREYGGVVNRFSCMYGVHQHGIVDQGWLSYFVQQKLKNEQVTIFGDGKQVRDVLYISDVVDLLYKQGKQLTDRSSSKIAGEVFSIGGGYKNTLSLLELCKKFEITPTFSEWRPSDQKVFYADISKAKKVLGWEPHVGIDEGLEKLVDWTKLSLTKNI